MRPRRTKDQIVSRILSICEGEGAGKTRIVYASNLNFQKTKEYLDLLIKNGLIESEHEDAALYRTTPRGIELLKHLKAIEKFIPQLCD